MEQGEQAEKAKRGAWQGRDFSKLDRQQLQKAAAQLQRENRRLKNQLAEHEPFKQKALRLPNNDKIGKLMEKFQRRKYALKVCYLGFNYDGMACQAEKDNSVEQYIFRVMHTLSLVPRAFPADQSFTRAGRTDKGVSAMGNVISLRLRTDIQIGASTICKMDYCSMLNALLPQDIRIIGCQAVGQDFNARYWCTSRRYKYFFARGALNLELMRQAIKLFEGTHNFLNFCKINVTNTVNFNRTIFSATIEKAVGNEALEEGDPRNEVYYFYYVGNSFLWHQIRFMSAVLFLVGQGKEPISIISDLLDVARNPLKPNYPMAPDYPLILQDCQYEHLRFRPSPQTIYNFYNTFNSMAQKHSIEKVLIINCMILARQHLLTEHSLSKSQFLTGVLESKQKQGKSMKMHKSSARGLEQTIKSLKGKKLELYLKKAEKQNNYDEQQRLIREQKEREEAEKMEVREVPIDEGEGEEADV